MSRTRFTSGQTLSAAGLDAALDELEALAGGGAAVPRIVTAAGPVTILPTDGLVVVRKSAPETTAVTLEVAPSIGRQIRIKDGNGSAALNPITVSPASGTVDGAASVTLALPYGSLWLEYTGVEWSVV